MDVPTQFAGNDAAKTHLIFDPLYGFIHLTPVEREIIHSPFYQRLRWIKQLGFSSYVFPGAEHSRFGHSIGVMHNAHSIIKSCNKAVSDEELMDISCQSADGVNIFFRAVVLKRRMQNDPGHLM